MASYYIPITSIESSIINDHTTEIVDATEGFSATDLSTKYPKPVETELIQMQLKDTTGTFDSTKLVKNKNLKSGNKKSFVWKYFAHPRTVDGIEDRSRTECLECKSQLAFNASGTTTTMLNHLKSRHPKIAETEEWRKMKTSSTTIGITDNTFGVLGNNESPPETLSPTASFDLHKHTNSSPEYKNSDVNVLSLFQSSNNSESKSLDHGRLLCLTKLIPHQLMVTSCLPTTNMDTNSMTTINNNHISMIQGESNGNGNGTGGSNSTITSNGSPNINSYYSANRSVVKRKRKKPICMQNANQLGINGTSTQHYQIKPIKLEKADKHEPSDLASIQSISAISHNSASINNILCHNFLPSDVIYNDNNNNTNSPPFLALKPFSTFTIPSSPGSPLASKMGITEFERVIVYWLIKDLRPYSILEETGMKTLFSSLMPSVTIPSVTNLKNQILPTIYWNLKNEILNDFSVECGAAFSIELWDIPTTGSMYASVKLNYYSNVDSQLRSKMFTTKEINVKYLCSDLLLSCCNEIGIDFTKIQFLPVVMNNPESMSDELANVGEIEQNKKFIIIPCLMSSLQEVAKVGFQEVEIIKLLDKCRALKELAGAYNLQLDDASTIGGSNAFLTSKYSSDEFELMYWVYVNLEQIVDKLDCFNSNRFNKDDEVFLKQLTPLLETINTSELSSSSEYLQENANSIKREDLHSIFGDDCFSQEPKSEVDQYLNEHKIDIEKNPIKWWKDNSSRFPNLSKLALKYLCIPLANQYGLESSETDSVVYARRRDIDPDEIDRYLFLNHNWR